MISRLFAILLLVVLSPIMLGLSLIIIIEDGFPIIFRQKRVGRDDIMFKIYKFRTMKKNTPNVATDLLENPEHLYTKFGPLLRKYSLDELPQLLNIVKGDLGFIGPRPALYNQIDLIKMRNKKGIQKLTPGLTGWAQVNGRDSIDDRKKVELDLYYHNNRSFSLHFKIIYLTILKVLKTENVKI